MKKLVLLSLCALAFVYSNGQVSFQQHGAIPYGDRVSEVKMYRYNAGSAPTEIGIITELIGTVQTSSGVATVYLTTDGTSTGIALFSNVVTMEATAKLNTGAIATVPLSSIKDLTSGKILTINAVESVGILLGGQGLEFAGTVDICFTVKGY